MPATSKNEAYANSDYGPGIGFHGRQDSHPALPIIGITANPPSETFMRFAAIVRHLASSQSLHSPGSRRDHLRIR